MTETRAARIEREAAQEVLDGLYQCAFLGLLLYPLWLYLDVVEAMQRKGLDLKAAGFWDKLNEGWADTDFKHQLVWSIAIRGTVVALMATYMRISSYARVYSVKDRTDTLVFLGALAQLALGFGVVALILNLEAFTGNYFCGLIMVFIVIAILTPWRPRYTLIQVAILTAAYVVAVFVHHHIAGRSVDPAVYSNLLFITAAAVLCCFGSLKTHELRTRLRDAIDRPDEPGRPARRMTSTFWLAPGTTRLETVVRRTTFIVAILALPLLALAAVVRNSR